MMKFLNLRYMFTRLVCLNWCIHSYNVHALHDVLYVEVVYWLDDINSDWFDRFQDIEAIEEEINDMKAERQKLQQKADNQVHLLYM